MTFITHNTPLAQTRMTLPFSGWAQTIITAVCRFIDHRAAKATFEELSEWQLQDIGLTRNDVSSIAHMPLPSAGVSDLAEIAKSRSGNW